MVLSAQAPGKLLVAGEYAVLEGRRAIVMAVDRRAVARVREQPVSRRQPEVDATLARAVARGWLASAPSVTVDTRALGDRGAKYGLGSSAAACVAALGAALAHAGHDVGAMRRAIGACAREGHRAAQGGGSGVDVLASALGGVQSVTLGPHPDDEPTVEAVAWQVPFAVLWTGASVRTRELLAAVRALRERDSRGYSQAIASIASAAERVYTAVAANDAHALVTAVRDHGAAMDVLGQASGVPIVTDAMRAFAVSVIDEGAAVKPSGAGGGDVVLVVGTDAGAVERAVARGVAAGFRHVELTVDRDGVTALG